MNPILVALDLDSEDAAVALARRLRGTVGGFKIGSQLFTAAGPTVVRALVDEGDRVFLDLKFHDIPNTVKGSVEAAARLGVWMLNVHASGGVAMMAAAREAAERGAAGGTRPLVIGVTVLTSMDAATLASIGIERTPLAQVVDLARLAHRAGLDGVVASPLETRAIQDACGPAFVIVTPGIRGAEAQSGPDAQQRTLSPVDAMAAGSSFLVIGRPITGAADPRAAAERIAASLHM